MFIEDNIVAAQELIFNIQKQKLLGYAFKVDFTKAFDSLDWNFLLHALTAWGFGLRWITKIHNMLSTAKARVLINGASYGYIHYKRGLRRGDPLSHLLFALAVDALSVMFTNTQRSNVLFRVPLQHLGNICHL